QDSSALARSLRGRGRRRHVPRIDAERQAHDEGAALADALAARLDRAAVQLDELPRERQAYAEPRDVAIVLRTESAEHREELRHRLGGDSDAGIRHADLDIRVRALSLENDAPGLERVAGRVVQQVREDLR